VADAARNRIGYTYRLAAEALVHFAAPNQPGQSMSGM
jgi:hypothetical protein